MSENRIKGYAQALLAVAQAEGDVETTRTQLAEVARAVEGNDQLRDSLSNNLLPAATRGQIVDDILGGKASDVTRSLVGMIVAAGRGSELGSIVDAFFSIAAAAKGRQMATVRTAVALTPDQKARLEQALSARTGHSIELENVVDPDVVGGAVTTIGDTVIDGSLRTRLGQMKDAI